MEMMDKQKYVQLRVHLLWINKNGVWIIDYINREDVEKKVLLLL